MSGGSTIPEWQSTHPDPGNRIEATEARLKTVTKPLDSARVNQDEFLAIIDGMVFGEDPGRAISPGPRSSTPHSPLRWISHRTGRLKNTDQAVAAISPEKNAILELTAAGNAQPCGCAAKVHGQRESAGWYAAQHHDQRQSGDSGAVFRPDRSGPAAAAWRPSSHTLA